MKNIIIISQNFLLFLVFFISSIGLSAQECGVVYVTPTGVSAGVAGTKSAPASLAYGLTLASPANPRIWMAFGNYPISSALQIPSGITIEGGFDPSNSWTKSILLLP